MRAGCIISPCCWCSSRIIICSIYNKIISISRFYGIGCCCCIVTTIISNIDYITINQSIRCTGYFCFCSSRCGCKSCYFTICFCSEASYCSLIISCKGCYFAICFCSEAGYCSLAIGSESDYFTGCFCSEASYCSLIISCKNTNVSTCFGSKG